MIVVYIYIYIYIIMAVSIKRSMKRWSITWSKICNKNSKHDMKIKELIVIIIILLNVHALYFSNEIYNTI